MLHLQIWTLSEAVPKAGFGMAAEGKPAIGQGSGIAAGHQVPSKNVYCRLKGKWAEKALIQFPPLHVVWLKSPHLLVFCRGSGNSSNSSSFVAGQIPFRLLGLLRLCWKITLQSAVLDPIEDQRYALNYTIESFSAKDDRTEILYPQQQEYRTLHTLRKTIKGKKKEKEKRKKGKRIM